MKNLKLITYILLFIPIFVFSDDFLWVQHWIKGKNLFDKHDYKNAISEYTLAIDISKGDPQCIFLYNERALAYLKLAAYQESLKDSKFVTDSSHASRKEALRALWNSLFCNLLIDEPDTEQKNLQLLSSFDARFGILIK